MFFCYGKNGYCDLATSDYCNDCKHLDGSGGEEREPVTTNYERIKNMSVLELARFLESLVDGENNHDVGCYGCSSYGTHHSDSKYRGTNLYECEDCPNEGVGLDLVKWLNSEVTENEK